MRWIKKQVRSLYRRRLRWFPDRSFSHGHPWVQRCKAGMLEWLNGAPVPMQGMQMYLDLPDSLGLRKREIYEPLETAVILQLVQPGMRVLDLGANIGYYTLLISRAVGEKGHIWAFEPDPDNFAILQRNLALNECPNVTPHQMAAGEAPGKATLYRSLLNRGDNRLSAGDQHRNTCEIDIVRIDDVLPSDPIDFVKMDIQGAEGVALAGMQACLDRSPNVQVLFEYWPEALREGGTEPEQLLRSLRGKGFRFYRVDESNKEPLLTSTPIEQLTDAACVGGVNLLISRQPISLFRSE